MEKFKLNELLKVILIILLLISFSNVSFGYYQIMKYVLMSTFIWLIISETDSIKKGWKFLFLVLAVLFNPFFELKIGKELWKVVDVFTIIILFINIIETLKANNYQTFSKYTSNFYLRIKKFSINLQSIYVKTMKFKLPLFGVIFLILGFFIFKKEAEEKALKMEVQHQADSIDEATRTADSLAILEGMKLKEDKWIYLSSSDDGEKYYFNPAHTTRSNGIIKTWIKTEIEKGKLENYRLKLIAKNKKQKKYYKYTYSLNLYEFDCQNRTIRINSINHYNNNDEIIESTDSDNNNNINSTVVIPGSIGEVWLVGVCAHFNN